MKKLKRFLATLVIVVMMSSYIEIIANVSNAIMDLTKWHDNVYSYTTKIAYKMSDTTMADMEIYQKWLFYNPSLDYENLNCIRSGAGQDTEYTEYNLYTLQSKAEADSSSVEKTIYDILFVDGNVDVEGDGVAEYTGITADRKFKHILWEIENFYVSSKNDSSTAKQSKLNTFTSFVGASSLPYGTNETITNKLHNIGVSAENGMSFTTTKNEQLIKALQNEVLLPFVKQTYNRIVDLSTIYEPTGNWKNPYTEASDDVQTYTSKVVSKFTNLNNSNGFDINSSRNMAFHSGNMDVKITATSQGAEPLNNRSGTFTVTNPYNSTVTAIAVMVNGKLTTNYKVINATGNEVTGITNLLTNSATDGYSFRIQAAEIDSEYASVQVVLTVDYGEITYASLLVPNSEDIHDIGNGVKKGNQFLININKKHVVRSVGTGVVSALPEFDLALTKQIVKIRDPEEGEAKTYSRLKYITTNGLADRTEKDAVYVMEKSQAIATPGSIVEYEITVYNEGQVDGFAEEITDYLPDGLSLASNSSINTQYGWKTDSSNSKIIRTSYLSSSNTDNKLSAFSEANGLDSRTVKVECVVSETAESGDIIDNRAEISKYSYWGDSNADGVNEAIAISDDDDSTSNSVLADSNSSSVSALISKIEDDITNNTQFNEKRDDKNVISYEDDDDIERITVNKKIVDLDLALRKWIVNVDGTDLTGEDSREPVEINSTVIDKYDSKILSGNYENVNILFAQYVYSNGGLEYTHPKGAVNVEPGSIVTYRIGVFNEGNVDAYAEEITDYLPVGLEFIEDNETNIANRWTATKNSDGTTTVKTDILSRANGEIVENIYNSNMLSNVNKVAANNMSHISGTQAYKTIDIVCKVKDDVETSTYFTNRAEITKYGYYKKETDTNMIEANEPGIDIDSEQDTIKTDLNLENWYQENYIYTYNVNTPQTSYSGVQDDDDFETVYVEVNKTLDLALVKTITSYTNPGEEKVLVDRFAPETDVDTSPLDNGTGTDAIYTVKKNPVLVKKGATINYTIYVFNEGESDATVNIVDYLPAGLIIKNVGEGLWNAEATQYGTKISSTNDNSKDVSAYQKDGSIKYETFQVTCTVATDSTVNVGDILTNYAEISTHQSSTEATEDIDSTPSTIPENVNSTIYGEPEPDDSTETLRKNDYQKEDDDDFERIKIVDKDFDLALRKYISKINDNKTVGREPLLYGYSDLSTGVNPKAIQEYLNSGATTYDYEHSKEPLEVSNGDYVTYTIRVYNEGSSYDYYGYAYVIIDNLPLYLDYDAEKTAEANADIEWLDYIEYDSRERKLIISAKNSEGSDDYILYDMSHYVRNTEKPYQEVNIVCKVNAPTTGTEAELSKIYSTDETKNYLINTANITEYYIRDEEEENGYVIINGLTEPLRRNTKVATDRDSTVSNNNTDSSNVIYSHAEDEVAQYDGETAYIPGVQDDDDFDTIYIRKVEGEYSLNVKKLDSKTLETIDGVKFSVIAPNNTTYTKETRNGIANLISTYSITNAGEDIYTVTEVSTVDGYKKLQYHNIIVKVTTGANSDGSAYIPLNVSAYAERIAGAEGDEADAEEAMIAECIRNYPPEIDGTAVTVTLPNEPTTDYNVKIQKVDSEDNSTFLSTAKFTITGPDGEVILNNSGIPNGIKTIVNEEVSIDKTYTYTIKEEEVPDSEVYKDIFKGAYIELHVVIDEDGNINQDETNYEIIFPDGLTTAQKRVRTIEINNYIHNLEYDETTNTVIITIENPKFTGDYSLRLEKIGENSSDAIRGVSFKINNIKYTTDTNGFAAYTLNNSTSIPITSNTLNTVDEYKITEIDIGDNNYISLANGFTVYVTKGLVSESYTATGVSFTKNGTPQTEATVECELKDGSTVNVTAVVSNGLVRIIIPNNNITGKYSLNVKKVNSVTNEPIIGAKFTIGTSQDAVTTTSPDGIANLITDAQIASDNITYSRIIKEVSTVDGYKALEYYDVLVQISTKIETTPTGIKQYVPDTVTLTTVAKAGTDINSDEAKAEENYLNSNLSYDIEENIVTVNIPNEPVIDYNFKLVKVDHETNEPLNGAEFEILDANKNESNKTVSTDGLIIENEDVSVNTVYQYRIREISAPTGYNNNMDGIYVYINIGVDEYGNLYLPSNRISIAPVNSNLPGSQISKLMTIGANYLKGVSLDSETNTVTVKVSDTAKKGSYSLNLVKVGENTSEKLSGVEFKIESNVEIDDCEYNEASKKYEVTQTTASSGEISVATEIEITNDTVNDVDSFTITEVSVGENKYVPLSDSVTVYVSKEESNGEYVLKGVSFTSDGEPTATATTTLTLQDETTVEATATIQNNTVTLTIANNKLTGNYKLQLVKVDSVTNQKLAGVNFTVEDSTGKTYNTASTDSEGNTKVKDGNSEEIVIKEEGTDRFIITETSTIEGYSLIQYHNIIVDVTKSVSNSSVYEATDVTVSIQQKNVSNVSSSKIRAERTMLNKGLKANVVGGLVTITIPNLPTTTYTLRIEKQDNEDDTVFLDEAKFTLTDADGNKLVDNSSFANGVYTNTFTDVLTNYVHSFTLTEDEVPEGYKNVFDGIKFTINVGINEDGTINSSKTQMATSIIDTTLSLSEMIAKKQLAESYIGGLTINGSTVKVILKNPKIKTDFSFTLNKYLYATDDDVSGAQFIVSERIPNGGSFTENEIGTYTTPITSNIISEQNVEVGSVYYYKIEETSVPSGYSAEYIGIYFTVTVSLTGEIATEITDICVNGTWEDANYVANYEDYVSIEKNTDNNFQINWANKQNFNLKLNKSYKKGETEIIPSAQAEFKVESVEWSGNTTLFDNALTDGTYLYEQTDVIPSTTYQYLITETNAGSEFSNLLINFPMLVNITIDADGNILEGSGNTYIRPYSFNYSTDVLFAFSRWVSLEVEDNTVNINMVNDYSSYYSLGLAKINADATTTTRYKEGAEFEITMPDGSTYDADPDISGTQNLVTEGNGPSVIGAYDIQPGQVVTYEFTEIAAPIGYIQLQGKVVLTLDFTNITDLSQFSMNDITVKYYDANNVETALNGLTVTSTAGLNNTPVITVVVPNEGVDHKFKLTKVDTDGNLIQSSTASSTAISTDCAAFTIDRKITAAPNAPTGVVGSSERIFANYLTSGTYEHETGSYANATYVYELVEVQTKEGYTNVFLGRKIYVYVVTDASGRVKAPTADNTGDTHFEIGVIGNETAGTVRESEYLALNLTEVDGEDVVELVVTNPTLYKLQMLKVDTAGNSINVATLRAVQVEQDGTDGLEYTMENANEYITSEVNIDLGEVQHWHIYEDEVDAPYVNIFATMYLDVEIENTSSGLVLNGYTIYGTSGVAIDESSDLYNYVDVTIEETSEGYRVVVTVQNPITYKVSLIKYDTDGNEITNAYLSIEKYDNMNQLQETYVNSSSVIDGETVYESRILIDENSDSIERYNRYSFKEISVDEPYVNILEDKSIEVYTSVDPNGNLVVHDWTIFEYDEQGNASICEDTSDIIDYINVIVDKDENGISILKVELQNPYQYKLKVTKTNTNGEKLSGAILLIEDTENYEINPAIPEYSTTETNIDIGETKTYKITEFSTRTPYVNILKNKYILLNVTMKADGNIETTMKIYNAGNDSLIDESDDVYSYVHCTVDDEDIDTVNVVVENPITYNVNITKWETNENVLSGASIDITLVKDEGNVTYNNEERSSYTLSNNIARVGDEFTYKITENSTVAPHVNVLEGKYILLKMKINEMECIEVEEFKVYNSADDTLVDESDVVYSYIGYRAENTANYRTIFIQIKNPIQYRVKLVKYDTAENEITNANLQITRNGEVFTNIEGENKLSSINISETNVNAGDVTSYTIRENSVDSPYVNILENKAYVVVTRVDARTNKLSILTKFLVETTTGRIIYSGDEAFNYINCELVTGDDGIQTVLVKLQNPYEYKFKLTKTDTNLPPSELSGPILRIEKDGEVYTNMGEAVREFTEDRVEIGNVSTYKITELSTTNPHVNVLGRNYIKFNVEMLADGNVQINNYAIYTPEGEVIDSSNELYSYVDCYVDDQDVDVVNVKVQNPVKFKVSVHKVDTSANALSGANIDILVNDTDEYNNNELANYYIPEKVARIGDVVTYKITENSTQAPHINVLEGKYIYLVAKVKEDETVEVISFYICDATTGQKVIDTDVSYNYVSYEILNNSTPDIAVTIVNPIEYNFELIKRDTNENEISCAKLVVERENESYVNNGTSRVLINETNVAIGDTKTYIIKETNVDEPYVNILDGKYIEATVRMNEESRLEVLSFILRKEGSGIPLRTLTYLTDINKHIGFEIVQNNGVETLQVILENPYSFNFQLTKRDMENNNLKGALFNIEQGGKTYTNRSEAVRTIEEKDVTIGSVTTYKLTEVDAPAPFVNILKGYYVTVDVTMQPNGRISVTDEDIKIYNAETNAEVARTDAIYGYVSYEITTVNNVDTINIIVKDPIEFKVNVIKEDTDGEELAGPNIKVEVANKEFNTEGKPNYTVLTRGLKIGQEVVYKITETETIIPHVNILDGKYILLTARIEEGWNVSIADLVVYSAETDEPVADDDIVYDFIKKSTIEEAAIPTIVVEIENPLEYKVNVNKSLYGTDGRILMNNVGIKIDSEFSGEYNLITDENGNVNIYETAVRDGKYEYKITETKTSGEGFINILEGYYIKVFTELSVEGELSIVDIDGNASDRTYYIYNSNTDELVDFAETEIDKYISVEVTETNGVYSLDVYIENPQEFNILLNKYDRTAGEKMNDVKFNMKVTNEAGDGVILTSSKELGKEIDLSSLTTSKVNGEDGVIEVNNILIEKAGTYTVELKENLTDEQALLYHDVGSLRVQYKVVESNGAYIVKDVKVIEGEKYISVGNAAEETAEDTAEDTTEDTDNNVVESTDNTITIRLEVFNEQLKGNYKLDIVKIDDYSEKLENIGFKINDEDLVTDQNGSIPYEVDLEGKGWYYEVITETDSRNATNGKDYAQLEEFRIYRYTDIVNNKYVVTKIGFSTEEGNYVEIPSTGNVVISQEIKTENPDRITMVVITADAPDSNGMVSAKVVIPNPEVKGEYKLNIVKVDENNEPVPDVTFKVNGMLTKETDENGIVNVVDKELLQVGTDEYIISEVNAAKDLLVLAEPVTVKVNTIRMEGKYVAVKAYFDNDIKSTSKKVMLEDGKTEVTLKLALEDNVVTLTIPNKRVIFDLALVKYVTEADVTEKNDSGKYVQRVVKVENAEESDDVLKVDLAKANLKDVTVKFKYTIKVTNEGEIAGYVKELSDYIPEGLKFVAEDNTEYGWKQAKGKVVTSYLEDTLLQPGESASVEIILTWINDENNLGVKVNVAEISEDYNDRHVPDIDSTPNNQVPGEDDIDSAMVMLAVRTGSNSYVTYILIAIGFTTIIAVGIVVIKKQVIDK